MSLQKDINAMLPFDSWREPVLDATEKCILSVMNEVKFTAQEKAKLIDDYSKIISEPALMFFIDRISLIERLKIFFRNRRAK